MVKEPIETDVSTLVLQKGKADKAVSGLAT